MPHASPRFISLVRHQCASESRKLTTLFMLSRLKTFTVKKIITVKILTLEDGSCESFVYKRWIFLALSVGTHFFFGKKLKLWFFLPWIAPLFRKKSVTVCFIYLSKYMCKVSFQCALWPEVNFESVKKWLWVPNLAQKWLVQKCVEILKI